MKKKAKFIFDSTIPKFWNNNKPFSTHLLNSFTLLFPVGEKFFIKSLLEVLPQLNDEKLKEEIKWFVQQEASHAHEHEKFFKNLNQQGHNLVPLLLALELTEKFLTNYFSSQYKVSLTAAFEHMTALLAQLSLEKNFFSNSHPSLKDLFEWHAFEEIEHRHVAFNVLKALDTNENIKNHGMVVAFLIMLTFSSQFTIFFLAKDNKLFDRETWDEFIKIFFREEKLFREGLTFMLEYFDQNFHPLNNKKADQLLTSLFNHLKVA